jgi:hypothetical protein
MNYIYLDIEKAKLGSALVYEVRDEAREDYETYFEGKALEFVGDDLPHFITYDEDTNTISESTEEEKYANGFRTLADNEVIIDDVITSYDADTQHVLDGVITDKDRAYYILEGTITLETEKAKARTQRTSDFEALDLYDKAVLRGDVEENAEMKAERDIFRSAWLSLPNSYSDISVEIETLYPDMPEAIKYFV